MKRLLCVLCACLTLTACSSGENSTSETENKKDEAVELINKSAKQFDGWQMYIEEYEEIQGNNAGYSYQKEILNENDVKYQYTSYDDENKNIISDISKITKDKWEVVYIDESKNTIYEGGPTESYQVIDDKEVLDSFFVNGINSFFDIYINDEGTKDFFDKKVDTKDNEIILTITCPNVDAYNQYRKKKYNNASEFTGDFEIIGYFDQDANLKSIKLHSESVEDGIYEYEYNYKHINEPTYTIDEIENFIKEAKAES